MARNAHVLHVHSPFSYLRHKDRSRAKGYAPSRRPKAGKSTVNLDAQHDSVHPHPMPVGSTDRRL
ncbi:hypothetical protein E4U25_002821 [Claviceps purpurea]|nr:hypothetical protein E4U25_002821 [Claviceps purpurea]